MALVKRDELSQSVFFCDPAAGKNLQLKRVRARSAIVGLEQDLWGHIFVKVAWAERCSTDRLTDKIFEFNELFKPRTFGIEANAMQTLYGDMVAREAKFRSRRVPILEVHQKTTVEKDWRIRTVIQPLNNAGRLFLLDEHVELRAEIRNFPMTPTKDLVDALASAIKLLPPVHSRIERDSELDKRLAYLRESGAPLG